ncbi:MAG TPA: DUF2278 family protein [Ohtaekwangia sp.]|uniref:DUF2278 family protein n=1 Tax=Ohtaekwangia sp. TaxID=2066019 RepID=UPI002F943472
MPINHYGVLKGKAVDRIQATPSNEHFQIKIDAGGPIHRIAVNVKSQLSPPEVLFYLNDDYRHAILQDILDANLADGYTHIASKSDSIALDFIRKNLFPREEMRAIPYNKPGADNDLNEKIDFYIQQAIQESDARVYAFGEKWGPENGKPDKYFHFEPGNGIHDIHMNQGNSGRYANDNGVYQDGGLLLHFPSRNKWVALFIAFQVQSWHTDDVTGHPLADVPQDHEEQPENSTPIRIIAAMVNPRNVDVGKEYIILLNKSDQPVDIEGWKIVDKTKKNTDVIDRKTINGGDAIRINLSGKGAQLGNNGGIITLLNKQGIKIDGVSYTKKDVTREGFLIEL